MHRSNLWHFCRSRMYINSDRILANEVLLKQRSHPSKENHSLPYLIRNTKGTRRDNNSYTSSHNKQANPNGRRQSEIVRGQSEKW